MPIKTQSKLKLVEDHVHLIDPRTLDLTKYLTLSKLNIPAAHDWTAKKTTPWGMMGNWALPDCTCAAAGHMIECWTAQTGSEVYIDDNAILNAYIALTGYDPVTGANDTGIGYTNLLKYWRKTGIGSHKIQAYTAVKYTKPDFVRACIYLFGGAFAGLNLPKSFSPTDNVWDLQPGGLTGDNAPGSDGGHAITLLGYDEEYITFISYGEKKRLTWSYWNAYASELYAVISPDFFSGDKTAHGLDMAALEADLIRITREKPLLEKELVNYLTPVTSDKLPVMANAINTDNPITLGTLQVMAMDIGQMNWVDGIIASEALGEGWRLPTLDELSMLYNNRAQVGRLGDFVYWSANVHGTVVSTGEDDKYRYYMDFSNGSQGTDTMDKYAYIRAVRNIVETV